MIKAPIDYTLPGSSVMQSYVERSDALLAELHHCISAPQFEALTQAVKSGWKTNPLTQGSALREAIFYGGESAYTFQYQQLMHKKYSRDANWLRSHKAFMIDSAFQVVRAIQVVQNRKIMSRLSDLRQLPVEKWTVLSAFSFSVQEIASESHVPPDEVQHMLRAFSLPQSEGNSEFRSISDFNAANAWPLLEQANGDFFLLQTYALLESMYESPFYWMLGDSSYIDEAMKHRGEFAEGFAHERLELVFGRERVFSNVEILAGDGSKAAEIDVLVVYADRIVIVQAKAKRLTIAARKGNDGHIRSDFKAAIQDAYEQGYRCATTIGNAAYTLRAASGAQVKLGATPKEIFIFCIVSDHYPALAFQASQFLKYHTTASIRPPLVTDVFLLDAMT
jgi:hypothetical protein